MKPRREIKNTIKAILHAVSKKNGMFGWQPKNMCTGTSITSTATYVDSLYVDKAASMICCGILSRFRALELM